MKNSLYLVLHGRFPSGKAIGLWIAKGAEAFSDNGVKTTVIAADSGVDIGDPFDYYSVKNNFRVKYIHRPDLFSVPILKKVAFIVSNIAFALSSLFYLLRHAKRGDIILSNEALPMFLYSLFFKNVFYEMHVFPERKIFFFRLLFSRMRGFVSVTKWMADETSKVFSIPRELILWAPSGVDLAPYEKRVTREDARQELSLSREDFLIVYTGHLYDWKGLETLTGSLQFLNKEYRVILVAGPDEDGTWFPKDLKDNPRIEVVMRCPHEKIHLWQIAADVLALPNTAKKKTSSHYTSPMKLFQYMASGTPIVASNVPSVNSIVSEDESFLFIPDDPKDLAQKITYVSSHIEEARRRAERAREKAKLFSWENKSRNVISFLDMTSRGN